MEQRQLMQVEEQFDIVVTGAGIAGISAALTAARSGRRVALICDRPVLGGAASSEMRVGPGGANSHAHHWNRYAKETGVMEEIYNHLYYRAANAGKWRWFYFDQLYFDLVWQEPDLTCYLNTSVYKVNKDAEDHIASVEAIQQRSEKHYVFRGDMFIDCSGDGTVGFLAGADYRMGRESREEYGERFAPPVADKGTMGATLLFTSVDTGHPVRFTRPDWAVEFDRLESFPRLKTMINKMPDGSFYGFWGLEYGGALDSIHDDDEVIRHLRGLIYGVWDYIKNSGEYAYVENHEINWIGYLPAKRESRRLLGPYIATSNDFLSQKDFEDRIGYAGWPIDIHPPRGYQTMEPGCTHEFLPGISDIPYRCLYSRNLTNLFFAGRDVSCTHEGLGTLRLIQTTSVMGQAAGMAAAMCVEKGMCPGELYPSQIPELQRRLARSDQSIKGYRLLEENDYSRRARITVSSVRKPALEHLTHWRYMEKRYGVILPLDDGGIRKLSFYLEGAVGSEPPEAVSTVILDLYACVERPENYRSSSKLAEISREVTGRGWVDFGVDIPGAKGKKVFALFRRNPSVKLYLDTEGMTGVAGLEGDFEGELEYDSECMAISSKGHLTLTPCFRMDGGESLYDAANLNNGYIRPFGLPNLWASEAMHPGRPEWVCWELEKPSVVSRIELVFNSDLNAKSLRETINHVAPQLVKTYEIMGITDQGEVSLVLERENFKRFVVHTFAPVQVKALKLSVCETWGAACAEVFDVRIYGE